MRAAGPLGATPEQLQAAERLRQALPLLIEHRLQDAPEPPLLDAPEPPLIVGTPSQRKRARQRQYSAEAAIAGAQAVLPPEGARVRVSLGVYEGWVGERGKLTSNGRVLVTLEGGKVIQILRTRVVAE
jgi:hypothetical protein